jgi:hypothetical protein
VDVVAPEVREEFCVFVEPQKLTDDLDGEHFRVAQRGSGPTLSEAPEVLKSVVDEAEDRYDEGAKIHKRRPPLRLYGAIWINTERKEVFCVALVLKETCTLG